MRLRDTCDLSHYHLPHRIPSPGEGKSHPRGTIEDKQEMGQKQKDNQVSTLEMPSQTFINFNTAARMRW